MTKPVGMLLSRPRHPITGKRIHIKARTRRELDAFLHRLDVIRQEQRLGIATDGDVAVSLRGLARKRVTLLEAADSYASLTRLSPRTRAAARNVVRDGGRLLRGYPVKGALFELAGERLEALTAPRVAKHFRAMAETHAWQSVITSWRKLRAIIRHAAEEGWIMAAPWGMWRPAKPTHAKEGRARRDCCRSALEREALLQAAIELGAWRLAAVVAVGAFTGPRKGEIAGLKWFDWDQDAQTLTLMRQGDGRPTKEGQRRKVLAPELGGPLATYRARLVLEGFSASATSPMFPTPRGNHVRSGNVIDVDKLRAAAARAGLGDPKRWSLHSLRDSFVTIEAQACGGDLRRLAERTGHRSIDSLLRYLQTFDREARPRAALPPAGAST